MAVIGSDRKGLDVIGSGQTIIPRGLGRFPVRTKPIQSVGPSHGDDKPASGVAA